jgi:hypothetical protein
MPELFGIEFEWDEDKATSNLAKHGVSFDEAKTVFGDPLAVTLNDPEHSFDEQRFIDVGLSEYGELLVVSYTERADKIRLISCRQATGAERKQYEEGL